MATLPDAVQRQLVRWAGHTLDQLPTDRIPATLRQVARFRPNKRATLGAAALAAALDNDPGFRAEVAEHVRGLNVDPSGDQDLLERAAAAYLWDHPAGEELLVQAAGSGEVAALRQEVDRLTRELAAATKASKTSSSKGAVTSDTAEKPAEPASTAALDRLRQRLRDQGAALKLARDAAATASEQATAELKVLRIAHDRAQAELKNTRERLDQEQSRADRAVEQLSQLQAGQRSAKDAAHRRIELLLETVEQASQGLRREWQLTAGGPEPADRVADSLALPPVLWTGGTATLSALLALPKAHLIVDGYNVTKTGYPQLTLAQQRDRLVRELASLAARLPAEMTVVFDGASVVVPQSRQRGVRVIYSPVGVSADDVIRQLVAAEPIGRVLLVTTADKEIITSVSRLRARTVTPTELLATLQYEARHRTVP